MRKAQKFMKEALKEAKKALTAEEVPVGAVLVHGDKVIARAYNQVETLSDATAHAEMIALTSAMNYIGSKYLNECELYITLEPCVMCAGACMLSKLKRVSFGAYDPKQGYTVRSKNIFPKKTIIKGGVLEEECAALLKDFFQNKR